VYDEEVQTDSHANEEEDKVDYDEEYLGQWLESIYPRLSNILQQNAASKAFDIYDIQYEDSSEGIQLLYNLKTDFKFSESANNEEGDETDITGSFQDYQDEIDDWGDMQSVSK
jgi:hypothetical protein